MNELVFHVFHVLGLSNIFDKKVLPCFQSFFLCVMICGDDLWWKIESNDDVVEEHDENMIGVLHMEGVARVLILVSEWPRHVIKQGTTSLSNWDEAVTTVIVTPRYHNWKTLSHDRGMREMALRQHTCSLRPDYETRAIDLSGYWPKDWHAPCILRAATEPCGFI